MMMEIGCCNFSVSLNLSRDPLAFLNASKAMSDDDGGDGML